MQNRCILCSPLVAVLYNEKGEVEPEEEYDIDEKNFFFDENLPCPHYRTEPKIVEEAKKVYFVPCLLELCKKAIINSGVIGDIDESFPEELKSSLFAMLIEKYTVYQILLCS